MQAGSGLRNFLHVPSEMLAVLLSTVPGGVVTLRPTLPWGSTRNGPRHQTERSRISILIPQSGEQISSRMLSIQTI